jgi:hypothetical protein
MGTVSSDLVVLIRHELFCPSSARVVRAAVTMEHLGSSLASDCDRHDRPMQKWLWVEAERA